MSEETNNGRQNREQQIEIDCEVFDTGSVNEATGHGFCPQITVTVDHYTRQILAYQVDSLNK